MIDLLKPVEFKDPKLAELIIAIKNASFDCGESEDGPEQYDGLLLVGKQATEALRDYIESNYTKATP